MLTHSRNQDVFKWDSRVKASHSAPIPWGGRYTQKGGGLAAWRETLAAAKRIRSLGVDVGIDPRGDVRSQLLLLLCGCRTRTGFTNYLVNSNLKTRGVLLNRNYGEMEEEHRFEINRKLAAFALRRELPELSMPCFRADRLAAGELGAAKIVVHAFGGWEGKLWAPRRWAELLNGLKQEIPGREVLLCGAPEDEERLAELAALTGQEYRLTSLAELIGALKNARLFLGIDSGQMNLASALGVPVVALFGPGDSTRWRPLSAGSRFPHHKFDCNPCPQKKCVRPNDSCMARLDVDAVRQAVLEVLGDG